MAVIKIETIRVDVMKSVYAESDERADRLKRRLSGRNVACVNVLGSPGTGKTSVILRLFEKLNVTNRYVIEGDIESDLDAVKMRENGIETVQINTLGACHLDAEFVERAVDALDASDGILFIENIGNLVCPAEFNVGEHAKMLVCNVAEGADKPYKYPPAFEKADVILLNKTDLIPHVDFNLDYFIAGVRKINSIAPLFEVSAKIGEGFGAAADWINGKLL